MHNNPYKINKCTLIHIRHLKGPGGFMRYPQKLNCLLSRKTCNAGAFRYISRTWISIFRDRRPNVFIVARWHWDARFFHKLKGTEQEFCRCLKVPSRSINRYDQSYPAQSAAPLRRSTGESEGTFNPIHKIIADTRRMRRIRVKGSTIMKYLSVRFLHHILGLRATTESDYYSCRVR